jgi:diguanylate cyclase (GGDEF)-like protein/PAS domain S-box-containing protein
LFVATRDGTTLMHRDRAQLLSARADWPGDPALARALGGHSGWSRRQHAHGEDAIVAYSALRNADWVVGGSLPTAEAFAGMNRLQALTLGVRIGAAVLLLIFAALIVWISLLPLTRLRQQMAEIESGQRVGGVDERGPAEIKSVARAFNRLLSKERQSTQELATQKEFYRGLNDGSPLGVFLIDGKGRLTYANARCEQMLGRGFEHLRDWLWLETVHPDDRERSRANWLNARKRRLPFFHEVRAVHRNGDMVWLRLNAEPVGDTGHAPGYLHAMLDVSAEHAAAEALAREKERADLILATIQDALVVVDGAGCVTHLSPAAERLTAWARAAAAGLPAAQVLRVRGENGTPVAWPALWAAAKEQREDCVLDAADGRKVPVQLEWSRFHAEDGGVLAVRDVTRQREATRRYEWEAMHDPVTGMPNRRAFANALREAFARFQRDKTNAVLILIDLDCFKRVNDLGGHDAGDEMLQAVAELLTTVVRAADLPARIGGDEFALLLSGCTEARARDIAEKVRTGVQALGVWRNGERLTVGVSQGISSFCARDASAEGIRQRADEACYRAKNAGRNAVEVAALPTVVASH